MTKNKGLHNKETKDMPDITASLQDNEIACERLMQTAMPIQDKAQILALISKKEYICKNINDGWICKCCDPYQAPVLKIKYFADKELLTNYLESLRYHYTLKNCDNKILREHTLEIFRTFLFKDKRFYYVCTEFEYAEKTLADIIEQRNYSKEERIRDNKLLTKYLSEIHKNDNHRSWLSDFKPENVFITNGTLKIGDLEDSQGSLAYILPTDISITNLHQPEVNINVSDSHIQDRDEFAWKMVTIELVEGKRYLETVFKKIPELQQNIRKLLDYLIGKQWQLDTKSSRKNYIEKLLNKRWEEIKAYEKSS